MTPIIIDDPIRTQRLILRTLTEADARGPYLEWLRDPVVTRFLEVRFAILGSDDVATFIAEKNSCDDALLLAIVLAESGRHIGNIKLDPIVRAHRRAEVGLMIGDKAGWNKGFGAEAIAGVAEYAFTALGLQRMTAGCYQSNVGSLRAFEKAGFRTEATLPRHLWHEDHWEDEIRMARFRDGI